MQPSVRQQELERLYNARKGHAPQISISDDQHHVTEAIGSYYDAPNEHEPPNMSVRTDQRPLSFISGPSESRFTATPRSPSLSKRHGANFDMNGSARPTLGKRKSSDRVETALPVSEGSPTLKRMSSMSPDETSPSGLSRHNSTDTAVQPFPLNDIDYESSPAAVAQELSNLQAIRRMSMNVDTADPDLPSFVPAVAPSHGTSDDDPSKLFWVPARLHPELAPKEFKTFVEERVEKIRRRSGSEDALSPDIERSDSGGGLRRKKSMLSHQIDPKGSYEDGAERLERRRSKHIHVEGQATIANLHDLEELVNDPAQLVRRLSLDNQRRSEDGEGSSDDMSILPPVQAGLKRSTHTTYRRGSLRRGERVPFSKRALNRHTDQDAGAADDPPMRGISRVQTEPMPETSNAEVFGTRTSSMNRRREQQAPSSDEVGVARTSDQAQDLPVIQEPQQYYSPTPQQHPVHEQPQHYDPRYNQVKDPSADQYRSQRDYNAPPEVAQPRKFTSRIASQGRTTAQLPGYNNADPLPNIIETLPDGTKVPVGPLATQAHQFPERKSSFDSAKGTHRSNSRPKQGAATLEDLSSSPSLLPGGGASRTDALTMVPTFEERKVEKKDGGRKSSWKWILGNDDDDKKKDMKRSGSNASEDASSIKSGKSKLSKNEKARLDVLQTSMENVDARPRESLVLNRDDIKIDDDRKSKKTDATRKEKESKDSGLLSAIFGGKKKSSDSEVKEKKRNKERVLSPEPPPRLLKPDIDYNWTRFSILEERAIYRMAHIKLANPRRALYSQVLLSNFMYSYLAKVQMMHPQMQIPAAQQQKMQQEQQRQQKAKEQQSSQYQEYQQQNHVAQQQVASQQPGMAQSSYEQHDEYNGQEPGIAEQQQQQQQSEWPDYRTSTTPQHKTNGHRQHNGGIEQHADGYSVASTNEYMGYDKSQHQQQQQHHGQDRLWEDEEHEDLW